jgi:hypothetical protein
MGLLEAGNVVLRDALRILGVLRLGAGVAGVRNAVRVEGRTRGSAGVARRDAPCLSSTNGLIGLTLRPRYRMDIGGQSQAGGGYDQGSAKHRRHDKMFHGVLPKQSVLGKRRWDFVSTQLIGNRHSQQQNETSIFPYLRLGGGHEVAGSLEGSGCPHRAYASKSKGEQHFRSDDSRDRQSRQRDLLRRMQLGYAAPCWFGNPLSWAAGNVSA